MSDRKLYFVWGGIFTDQHWSTLEPQSEECYGPYHDPKVAERVWNEKARRNIDIAMHRLFVLSVDRPGGAAAGKAAA